MYNLAAEFASLIIICVAMFGLITDKSSISARYKGLKWMYISTLVTIVVTLVGIAIQNNYTQYPLWLSDVFRTLFFLTSPLLAFMYLRYCVSIVGAKLNNAQLIRRNILLSLPYVLYSIFVLTNPFHRLIFDFVAEEGYVRADWVRISYIIAFVYFAMLIVYAWIYRKSPQKNVLKIICLNLLIASLLFCIQIFFPYLQTSGLACVGGLIYVHFYVLGVSKTTDELTELNNRFAFTSQLAKLCNANSPFFMVVFSVRNFKSINERLGFNVGDAVLCDMASRLRATLGDAMLYRYSGDQFAYVEKNVTDAEFSKKIEVAAVHMCDPFCVKGNQISLDIVYARTDYPEFGRNIKEIVSAMDYSILSVKKNSGETSFFYDTSICDRMKRRNYIIDRLKNAIANDGFEVHYQPIYSASEKKFTLSEALVRFKPSDQQPISPGEFIPIAEEVGLVTRITYIVLEHVCMDIHSMMQAGINPPIVSVNFPYVMFLKNSTVSEVCKVLEKYDISPKMINIELTERTLVSDASTVKNVMDSLIAKGIDFELDDFGVEYSNLSLFFDIPINLVKFDRSLVYSATLDEERRTFFNHLLRAIKSMKINVVMEGVEERDLLDYLLDSGCEYIQGYVFSKPLPVAEFIEFMHEKN